MTDALVLDPKRTALVLIDLQRGIMGRQTAPHSAPDVLARSNQLAKKFREAGAPVVLVNVSFSPTGEDRLSQPIDAPAMPFNKEVEQTISGGTLSLTRGGVDPVSRRLAVVGGHAQRRTGSSSRCGTAMREGTLVTAQDL